MSQITVKSGKGELRLQKSRTLVGLKPQDVHANLSEQDFVARYLHTHLGGFQVMAIQPTAEGVDSGLDELRRRDDIAVGTHVYFVEGSNRPIVPTGEIYLTFEHGVSEAEQAIALDEFHLALVERRDALRLVVRVTALSPNPLKTAYLLQQTAMVKTAEPDLDMPVDEYNFNLPADDLLPHQWHLANNGQVFDVNYRLKAGADARVVDAWRRLGGLGSPNVAIAVIDNGFDLSHPDLKDKVVTPWDLWNNSAAIQQGDPRYTHGTPCASVALAAANGRGMVGSAPMARFMPVSGTSFGVRATEQMFDYCVQNGADIISCSWGTTDPAFSLSAAKTEAITRAARQGRKGKGCVILFAVGNENLDYVNFYAAHPDVIAVAASTSQDIHATYSNRGREVSVCAPSNGDWPITAARAAWDAGLDGQVGVLKFWRDGRDRGPLYKHFGGTSSATPLVAGVCALILSANPDLTAREVKEILQQTADKIGLPGDYVNGHSVKYGYGRINADRAVAEAIRRRDSGAVSIKEEVKTGVVGGLGLFRFDVRKQEPAGWAVQIGAFYDYGNVLIQAEKLQKQFAAPVVVSISSLQGKTVYKVAIGAYPDVAPARELLERVKAAGIGGFLKNLAEF